MMKLVFSKYYQLSKSVFYIVFLFFVLHVKAQENLVPNGSFEEYDLCPLGFADFSVTSWMLPTGGTSDYFNICSVSDVSVPTNLMGHQEAHSGNAYCGFASGFESPNENAREYLQVELLSELIMGKEYIFNGFFCLADSSKYCIKNLGAVFSTDAIGGPFGTPILFFPVKIFPQNSSFCTTYDWVEVNVIYVAQGGEKYLTIGLFFDDSDSEISVVNPLVQDFGYYFVDDISVREIMAPDFPNFFTPNNDGVNDFFKIKEFSDGSSITILNRWGNRVFHTEKANIEFWDGKLNGENYPEGVYFYIFTNKNNDIKTGCIHLIR